MLSNFGLTSGAFVEESGLCCSKPLLAIVFICGVFISNLLTPTGQLGHLVLPNRVSAGKGGFSLGLGLSKLLSTTEKPCRGSGRLKYGRWGIEQWLRSENWSLEPAVERWMLYLPAQACEVNVVVHGQSRFEKRIHLVIEGDEFGVKLFYFCLSAGNVSVICLLLKAFAVRLRGTLQCNVRPLLSFPCLLSAAGRSRLFPRGGSLPLFGHFRLVLHFR